MFSSIHSFRKLESNVSVVVGDGEISLGGKVTATKSCVNTSRLTRTQESATQIMGALQGAAVTAAGANAAGAATGAAAAAPATAGEPNTEQASAIAALAPPGSTISVPSSSGQDAPPQAPSLATGAGLGNDIEPRIRPRVSADSELDEEDAEAHVVQGSKEANIGALAAKRSERVHARDLSGFDRALNFAATALTTTPKIALGTGEGGSGVGIIQEAGINNGGPKTAAAAATTTTTTTAAPAKREVVEEAPEKRAKVTTVYIRQLPESSELEQAGERASAPLKG